MSWILALRHHCLMELVLPPGATGFLSQGIEPLGPEERRLAMAVVHEAARAAGGSAHTVEAKHVRSFETVSLTDVGSEKRQLWALLHRTIPWIAVVDHDPETTIPVAPHVIDLLLDPTQVSEAGWRLLRRDESLSSLSESALGALAQVEQEEIRHWRPATLGEVVFNHWD